MQLRSILCNHIQVKISISTQQCAICLRSLLHTAEIISAVCCTLRRSSMQFATHRRDFFETWSPDSAVCCTQRRLSLRCVHTARIVSAVCNTLLRSSPRYVAYHGDNFVIEYLGEIGTEFKKIWVWIKKYGGFRGVAVITSAQHAEGLRFDPGRKHFYNYCPYTPNESNYLDFHRCIQ